MAEELSRASYLEGESILHKCDARIKIALLLTFILTIALLPLGAWAVYWLVAVLLVIAMLLTQLPFRALLKRSLLIEFPIVLILLPQLFIRKGDFVDVQFFNHLEVSISISAVLRILSLLIRSWLSIQMVVLIAAVTRFEDMLAGLRACGMPRLLTAILGLMWRYLFVMQEEVQRMQRARAARSVYRPDSASHPGGSLVWRATVTGNMAGSFLLRSMERSERVYQAMLSRGYNGEVLNGNDRPLQFSQRLLIAAFILVDLLLLFISYRIYVHA